jgi:hypothetical protein
MCLEFKALIFLERKKYQCLERDYLDYIKIG